MDMPYPGMDDKCPLHHQTMESKLYIAGSHGQAGIDRGTKLATSMPLVISRQPGGGMGVSYPLGVVYTLTYTESTFNSLSIRRGSAAVVRTLHNTFSGNSPRASIEVYLGACSVEVHDICSLGRDLRLSEVCVGGRQWVSFGAVIKNQILPQTSFVFVNTVQRRIPFEVELIG